MTAASYAVLTRAHGFTRQTAFYSAVPGALSYVFLVASGSERGPRARRGHSGVPHLRADGDRADRRAARRRRARASTSPPTRRGHRGAAGARRRCSALALERAASPTATLYAGMSSRGGAWGRLGAGAARAGLQIAAQTLVGAWVGSRFIGFDWRLLREIAVRRGDLVPDRLRGGRRPSPGVAAGLTGAPFADALAAFAPGGLEAMTMMAFALGLDPLFVGAHHIARFLFISLALPWVARRIERELTAPRSCGAFAPGCRKNVEPAAAMLTWRPPHTTLPANFANAVCGDGCVSRPILFNEHRRCPIRRPMKSTAAPEKGGPRVNRDIRAVQVQLIDGEGQNRGVVNLADAQRLAEESGLDLVEIVPNASPRSARFSTSANTASSSRRNRPSSASGRRSSRSRRSSCGRASTTTITTSRCARCSASSRKATRSR